MLSTPVLICHYEMLRVRTTELRSMALQTTTTPYHPKISTRTYQANSGYKNYKFILKINEEVIWEIPKTFLV